MVSFKLKNVKVLILILALLSIALAQACERYFPFIQFKGYLVATWWVPYAFSSLWVFLSFFKIKVDLDRKDVSVWDSSYLLIATVTGFAIAQSWDAGWGLSLGVSLTVVIAVLSLVTTLHHSYSVRAHNRLQVRPHFVLDSTFNSITKEGYQTYRLSVRNVGLGPGVVSKYDVKVSKVPVGNSDQVFVEFLKLVNVEASAKGKAEVFAGYLSIGEALDKSSEKVLFQANIPAEGRSFMDGRRIAQKLSNSLELDIRYECHYGKQFHINRKKIEVQI